MILLEPDAVNFAELIAEQKRVATRVKFRALRIEKIERICGVDVAYSKDMAIACAAIWSMSKKSIETSALYRSYAKFPYVSGFLYKRELDPMLNSINKLEAAPDLVLVDGHGIAHPRKAGLAVFVGVELGIPTIGVAKSLLAGEMGEISRFFSPITIKGKRVGYLIKKKGSRKYFASPGNLVGVDDIPSIASIWNYDYPPPLRYADKLSRRKAAIE